MRKNPTKKLPTKDYRVEHISEGDMADLRSEKNWQKAAYILEDAVPNVEWMIDAMARDGVKPKDGHFLISVKFVPLDQIFKKV